MTMESVGKWCFIIGLVLVLVLAILALVNVSLAWAAPLLVILGLIVGFLNISGSETTPFLVAAIALLVMPASILGEIAWIGGFLMNFVSFLAAFTAPVALVVAIKAVIAHASD